MSTKKKASATGVRYTDAQKKEVVDFVAQYNSANGRGGQSAASSKFKVTPLTISTWIKNFGTPAVKAKKAAKAVKAAKPAKAPKAAKAGKVKGGQKGVRYSPEEKQAVVDFVASYNEANGRGGQNQAAKQFNVSVLTVSNWLKAFGGNKKAAKAVKAAKAPKAAKPAKAPKAPKATKGTSELEALKAAIRKLVN